MASLQPTSFRKPNCSDEGCQALLVRLSRMRPNQEAKLLEIQYNKSDLLVLTVSYIYRVIYEKGMGPN